jgi:Alpha galactosidase A/Alpha galactosidase C-terminal beta sandwich domain
VSKITRTPLFALALALGVLLAPACADGASPLRWSTPAQFDATGTLRATSCASESLCVAVDSKGRAFATSDPTASSPSWSEAEIDHGEALNAVSCAPSGLCVAVDGHGRAFASPNPGSTAWSPATLPNGGEALTAVSCPSASLCVAVDEAGNVLTSTNPASGSWMLASSHPGHHLTALSCPSQALCVSIDSAGNALASVNPTGGATAWSLQRVDSGELLAVSCLATGTCVAIDGSGDALASADPAASAATWSLTPIDGEHLTGVSCASSGLCVAVDGAGEARASDDPAASLPIWSASSADAAPLAGISCLPGGFCLALDTTGHSLAARVPAPEATTLAPTEITDASATLAGAVNPNDAVLGACTFEYATGGAGGLYNQSLPCSLLPVASSGIQDVYAQLTQLAPNTTYHYRIRASGPQGVGIGADEPFTTAVSSQVPLVHPNPSITGTPANGQVLTCHPGTPAGTSAQLTYAWLRDLIPIAGTTGATYAVKGQDTGHHLQCQVTATDGGGSATVSSSFVTIPVGGVPASAGETAVGKGTFKSGTVSVPITCSTQASGGCEVRLRLMAVETLSAGRVVAVAARSKRAAHKSAAALRRRTITLASVRVHLAQGAYQTVTAALSASAKRLLAATRHFTAYLYVAGTVIGVIEAQLAQQLLTLSDRAHSAVAEASAVRANATQVTQAPTSVLAATPYMGWDTYFAFGGRYSEATVLRQASELISLGLERRGYRYVWLDVGWWHGTRNANGEITVSPTQWPHGMAWLTRTLHAAGLRVGLYTDAGPNGCGGAGQGSYGHYQQDVNTFAAWGFDAVKVDFCGGAEYNLNPAAAYSAFHTAIEANSSHRPMLLSICDFLQPEQYGEGRPALDESAFSSYSFGPSVGNSWRTDTDVGFPGDVPFADVLRNMDADAAAPQAAGPGHWNDPDYLAPGQGMSAAQFRTQLSMWSMLAAPLMVSANLTKIGPASLAAVQNTEVIAIDQDPGGVQGTLVSSAGNGQVWVKPLIDGSRAIALLNRGSSATRIETSTSAVGLPSAPSYAVRNVWTHNVSATGGSISAEVPGDSTVLLRVSAR